MLRQPASTPGEEEDTSVALPGFHMWTLITPLPQLPMVAPLGGGGTSTLGTSEFQLWAKGPGPEIPLRTTPGPSVGFWAL
jgi:hypothetical protein